MHAPATMLLWCVGVFKLTQAFLSRPRLTSASLIALFVYILLARYLRQSQAVLLAFDLGTTLFFISLIRTMSLATPNVMRIRAERQIYGRRTVLILSVVTIGMVLLALHDELRSGKAQATQSALFAGFSIVLSWLFLAVNFAQEYAHQYALNRHVNDGGLMFPSTPEPDYLDFMYFSLTLSMACQTSDVQVTAGHMRRLVLAHSVMAFFFNVIIIALTINVLAAIL